MMPCKQFLLKPPFFSSPGVPHPCLHVEAPIFRGGPAGGEQTAAEASQGVGLDS